MHLKINPKPDLKDIRFSCDEPLHSKLDAYPLTRDFLNAYNTTALIDGHKSMIIMDDCQKALKDYNTLKSLKNIISNQRHLKCVNIILLQNWFALDKSLRELINNVILFKLGKSQTQKVFNEVVESHKDKFEQVRRLVYDAPHNWLFVNIKTQRMFKCFDEIIADEEESEDEDMEMKK